MSVYVKVAHRPSYNLVMAGLLWVAYELIVAFVPPGTGSRPLNLVDAWFDGLLDLVPYGHWVAGGGYLLITAFFVFRDRNEEPLRATFLMYMFAEALLWALVLYFNLSLLLTWMPEARALAAQAGTAGTAYQQLNFWYAVGLSFGAGFFEEVFFRLLLVSALVLFFRVYPLGLARFGKHIVIVLATAVLFSLAHHIPPYGEPFSLYPFLFRTVFGITMSLLLLLRGFGITAWTHALYDVLVDVRNYG
jgi:membrane protease YdiL (CAAX protease family)